MQKVIKTSFIKELCVFRDQYSSDQRYRRKVGFSFCFDDADSARSWRFLFSR
jgi:hypothetical protein